MMKIYTEVVCQYNSITASYDIVSETHEFSDKPFALAGGGDQGGGGMMQAPSTTTIQKSDPWEAQQPYLKYGFQLAQDYGVNIPNEYYPGEVVVPFSPQTEQALRGTEARAVAGSPLQKSAQDQLTSTLRGDYLSTSRPQFEGQLLKSLGGDAYSDTNPLSDYLIPTARGDFLYGGEGFNKALKAASDQILPMIDSKFALAGRSGSGLAQEASTKALADVFAGQYEQERANQAQAATMLSNLYSNDRNQQAAAANSLQNFYNQERTDQLRAMMFAPQMAEMDYNDLAKLASVGTTWEQLQQEYVNDAMAKWDFAQLEPENRIADFMNLIQGTYGGTNTTTSPGQLYQSPASGSFGSGLLGGAMGGAQLASTLGFGGMGMGVGGLLGGLLGGFF